MGLIQTPEQLRFSYLAIIEGAKYIQKESTENRSGDLTPVDNLIENLSSSPKRPSFETAGTALPLDDSNLRLRRSQSSQEAVPQDTEAASGSSSSNNSNNNSLSTGSELRRRQREERNRKLEEKIRDIKEKQKEAEKRSKLKSSLIRYGLLGFALFSFGAGLFYTYSYFLLSDPIPSPPEVGTPLFTPSKSADDVIESIRQLRPLND